ncbi:MAG: TonB-dependent receptor, partial [Bacteroidales bacterium]|nr:TonB-dependent receptor [Bacteroidales bacterium]
MRINHHITYTLLFLLSLILPLQAQDKASVFGSVSDARSQALEWVNIAVEGQSGGTSTDKFGYFEMEVPAGVTIRLVFSFVGYRSERLSLQLEKGESRALQVRMEPQSSDLPGFTVIDRRITKSSLTRVDPRLVSVIPSVGGGVESLLKTLPGVASNNELSSQYSVRGGNYDENLVYVNDVEIYRPFLVRSGQQEGLSFVNSDLVSSILFSAGGFEARYGDKMSSVLDIRYRKPTAFGGSAMFSLLGASLHLEGTGLDNRFTYLAGLRQKSNQFLLRNLETSGQYRPSFTDIQASLTYDLSEDFELSFLGNYARNAYTVVPESRETDFGTINEAYRFTVYFEGQEVDRFDTWMGALATTWTPRKDLRLKLVGSAYRANEFETYDILGQYYIGRLETDYGK